MFRNYAKTACQKCGAEIWATPKGKWCSTCAADLENTKCKRRQAKNKALGLCFCGRERVPGRAKCENCYRLGAEYRIRHKQERNQRNKTYILGLKMAVLNAYGHACAHCGDDRKEVLEIDHVGGWGTKHRHPKNGQRISGQDLYRYLRDNNYPKEVFRLLCGSCHSSLSYWKQFPPPRQQNILTT